MKIYRAIQFSAALTVVISFGIPLAMAQPEEEPAPDAQVVKVVKTNPNKRVCHRIRPTGSHIPTRVCLKQREWDEMRREARKMRSDAQETQRKATSGSRVGS